MQASMAALGTGTMQKVGPLKYPEEMDGLEYTGEAFKVSPNLSREFRFRAESGNKTVHGGVVDGLGGGVHGGLFSRVHGEMHGKIHGGGYKRKGHTHGRTNILGDIHLGGYKH